jgi:voltage-gated potassium channel Kch
LLAESNYRTQIEADIKPFRGLLLGLFFLTTGASVDPVVLTEQWPVVLALLGGLITFKAIITTLLGPFFGLSKAESVRTGLLLSGGGEFAFVVLTLADKLHVLPDQLAKVLVGVVVISMALTPYLSALGDKAAEYVESLERKQLYSNSQFDQGNSPQFAGSSTSDDVSLATGHESYDDCDVYVICGLGDVGMAMSKMLALPSITEAAMKNNGRSVKYVAFDLDPNVVISGFKAGKSVLYGDGSQPMVLSTAGIETPKGFIITYNDYEMSHKAVERLREAFPSVPILCRAVNTNDYFSLLQSGSTKVIMDEAESSMRMCSVLLTELGIKSDESDTIIKSFRDDFELESRNQLEKIQMQKGLVVKNMGDRVNIKDENLSLMNINNRVTKIMSDVSKNFKDLFDTPVVVQDTSTSSSSSSSTETVLSVSANKENADTSEVDKLIDELGGVTICPIPNKK